MKRTRISPQAHAVAAADGNGRGITSRLPDAPSSQQICPRQVSCLWEGVTQPFLQNTFPKSLFCCLTKPLPFPPASNLASFVNISWAACMDSCTKIFLTIETVITLLPYILHKVILFFLPPIFPKGECINGKEKTVACKQPEEQENGVLITSTHNVRLKALKTEKQIWIKIVNIMMVLNLYVQNLWTAISAITAMVMAKENDQV